MKRCPTCQRTFADDNLTFCLDDGSPLQKVDTDWADSPATAFIPEPRQTNPHQPPQLFNQPANPGLQFNSRTLGIIGASLLVLGVFMPLITLLGLISISYFQLSQLSAVFSTGIIVALIGIASLIMALKNTYRPLIAAGVLAIVILLVDFFRIKSAIASGLPLLQFPGARPGINPAMMGQALQSVIQISWGMFVMIAGAILLIVAGVKKDKARLNSTDWNRNPPPMSYS
jgi:hypothetical protein